MEYANVLERKGRRLAETALKATDVQGIQEITLGESRPYNIDHFIKHEEKTACSLSVKMVLYTRESLGKSDKKRQQTEVSDLKNSNSALGLSYWW